MKGKRGMSHLGRKVNCLHCKHYFVTWDYANPKGCRAFGFKSKSMPSLVAFQSSGYPCLRFEPKDKRK